VEEVVVIFQVQVVVDDPNHGCMRGDCVDGDAHVASGVHKRGRLCGQDGT
jgi:hypothetical protein